MTNARQTRPGVWEFQDEGMNVPGRIYATEKLFSTIEEGVFRQVRNVAKLPGILNASMAMPDAHYGYGFPIGGVAAFNLEKGVVSPGGVGYDINCLHGETEVLMADGSKLNIEDIELKDKVLVYTNSGVKKSRVLLTLTKKDNIYEVHTKQGFKINATADHPFLTPSGMLPLKSIGLGGVIALHENNLKWSVITSIRSVEKDALVYDFMVENENHNFIANNFVVSNCGVRLMTTNLSEAEVRPKLRQL
ncbi:MAG: hypothetical protein FJY77_05890, partial [Candidatus Altiarchaeales archaeon]|nr:hypothetical protein [Candidatus Altiarchaeales archaeon]